MDDDEFFLKDLICSGVKVGSMDFINIEENRIRLFYKPHKEQGSGFIFYVVEFSDVMFSDGNVECLYHGTAYYDGIRHLYMGHEDTDNVGYLYYPEPDDSVAIFKQLKYLCDIYCS